MVIKTFCSTCVKFQISPCNCLQKQTLSEFDSQWNKLFFNKAIKPYRCVFSLIKQHCFIAEIFAILLFSLCLLQLMKTGFWPLVTLFSVISNFILLLHKKVLSDLIHQSIISSLVSINRERSCVFITPMAW